MMKTTLFAAAFSLMSLQVAAQTISNKVGGSVTLIEPVGSMISINVMANGPSVFRGTFSQTFSHTRSLQNPTGTNTFTRNFNFGGNSNFNITSQFNQNVTSFTSSGWNFNW